MKHIIAVTIVFGTMVATPIMSTKAQEGWITCDRIIQNDHDGHVRMCVEFNVERGEMMERVRDNCHQLDMLTTIGRMCASDRACTLDISDGHFSGVLAMLYMPELYDSADPISTYTFDSRIKPTCDNQGADFSRFLVN